MNPSLGRCALQVHLFERVADRSVVPLAAVPLPDVVDDAARRDTWYPNSRCVPRCARRRCGL
jgi:hypothetical protein